MKDLDVIYEFYVTLRTKNSSETLETNRLSFDPKQAAIISERPEPVAAASIPFYQEIWFIILVCLIAVLLLIFFLATLLKSSGTKAPYIRDRMPLALPPLRFYDAKLLISAFRAQF